jgi:hypothetical protein
MYQSLLLGNTCPININLFDYEAQDRDGRTPFDGKMRFYYRVIFFFITAINNANEVQECDSEIENIML